MALRLELLSPLSLPVEVDSITTVDVQDRALREVEKMPVQCGNASVPVAELFRVTGSASEDQTIVWSGDCGRVRLIGAAMSTGKVRIEGHAGLHLGSRMTGGQIVCEGSAGDWVGAEMQGGSIHVRGDAGDAVGAAYHGARRGMRGGVIVIQGNAGHETGRGLRRGLIGIGGHCGDAAGYAMIAGTIVIAGTCGGRVGRMMKRGSIVLLDSRRADLLTGPGFRASGTWCPPFLPLFFQQLRQQGLGLPPESERALYRRVVGDQLDGGQGEVLLRHGDGNAAG